jgi:outer membrane immunogenic protein
LPGAIPSAGNIGGASLATQTVSLGVTLDLSQPSAANRPSSRTSPAVAAPAWSGFHVVAEAGGVWRDMIWTSLEALGGPPPFPSGAKAPVVASDPRAGGAVGYDWRFGSLLFGVDVEVGKSAPGKTIRGLPGVTFPILLPISSDSIVLDPSWEISPRARAGVLLSPSILAYATGGYAWQQFGVRASCTASFLWCSFDHYHSTTRWLSGWTAGAGLEVALDHGVFVRGEYSYVRLQDFGITIFPEEPLDAVSANVKTASSRASLGLGLRF